MKVWLANKQDQEITHMTDNQINRVLCTAIVLDEIACEHDAKIRWLSWFSYG